MCHLSKSQNDRQCTSIICAYSLRNKDKQTSCKYIGKVLDYLSVRLKKMAWNETQGDRILLVGLNFQWINPNLHVMHNQTWKYYQIFSVMNFQPVMLQLEINNCQQDTMHRIPTKTQIVYCSILIQHYFYISNQ